MTPQEITEGRERFEALREAADDATLAAPVVEALRVAVEEAAERWASEDVEVYEAVTGNRAMFAHPQWAKPDSGAVPFFTVAVVTPSDAPVCVLVPGSGDYLRSDFDAALAYLRSMGEACDYFEIRVPSVYDDECDAYEFVNESCD